MAVYTHISLEDINIFINDYEIGKLIEYEGISENTQIQLKI